MKNFLDSSKFESLGENNEKRMSFSASMDKIVKVIVNRKNVGLGKIVKHKEKSFDRFPFMATILEKLPNNLYDSSHKYFQLIM